MGTLEAFEMAVSKGQSPSKCPEINRPFSVRTGHAAVLPDSCIIRRDIPSHRGMEAAFRAQPRLVETRRSDLTSLR